VQHVQVDLVAQPGRERLHRAGGVVAAAVEAPVDQVLDPPAQRRERGHRDRRRRQAEPVEDDPDDREDLGDVTRRAGQPERVVDPHLLQWPRGQGGGQVISTEPVTLAMTTRRQRGERRWPLGSSSAGKVIPSAIPGAQLRSPVAATN
jgi:hypothetical protein